LNVVLQVGIDRNKCVSGRIPQAGEQGELMTAVARQLDAMEASRSPRLQCADQVPGPVMRAVINEIYSVYARTRKTEALNFSISAALSDSDFRVLA